MHIDNFLEVINACRFCFMCRHLDTTANVTFREADIPRGRALILDRVRMDAKHLANPDYINTMYDCALSAACRAHCVSDYDEAGLTLAARRDIVAEGLTPDDVNDLANQLVDAFDPVLEDGDAELLYVSTAPAADNFEKLMERAGVAIRVLRAGDVGKGLAVLGFEEQAQEQFAAIRKLVEASECTTVIASDPATFDALKNDMFDLEGIDVQHSSSFLLAQVKEGNLELASAAKNAYYIDSDFLRNYNEITDEPRALLEAAGYTLSPFGTNPEESYALGEGAVVFNSLRPKLAELLCKRLVDFMDDAENDLLIVASETTKATLNSYYPEIQIITLEEAL